MEKGVINVFTLNLKLSPQSNFYSWGTLWDSNKEKEVSSDSAADRKLGKRVQGKDSGCRHYEKAWIESEVPRLPLCWKFKQYESAANTLEMGKTGIIENSGGLSMKIVIVKTLENSLPLSL